MTKLSVINENFGNMGLVEFEHNCLLPIMILMKEHLLATSFIAPEEAEKSEIFPGFVSIFYHLNLLSAYHSVKHVLAFITT